MLAKIPVIFLLLLIGFAPVASAQMSQTLKTTDGAEYSVVAKVWDPVLSVRVHDKKFKAVYKGVGKGGMRDKTMERLRRVNPALYQKFRKITTAVDLEQDGRELYIDILPSVNIDKLKPGEKIECRIYLLEVRTAKGTSYIPVIRSIT